MSVPILWPFNFCKNWELKLTSLMWIFIFWILRINFHFKFYEFNFQLPVVLSVQRRWFIFCFCMICASRASVQHADQVKNWILKMLFQHIYFSPSIQASWWSACCGWSSNSLCVLVHQWQTCWIKLKIEFSEC